MGSPKLPVLPLDDLPILNLANTHHPSGNLPVQFRARSYINSQETIIQDSTVFSSCFDVVFFKVNIFKILFRKSSDAGPIFFNPNQLWSINFMYVYLEINFIPVYITADQ